MEPVSIILIILGGLLAVIVGATLLLYIIVPVFKGVGFVIRQLFNFVIGEIGDVFRLIGAIVTGILFIPMTVGSVVFGRWSAAAHYGRAIKSEVSNFFLCIYRIAIGHPARLFCLHGITEGLERRLPAVVAAAPGADAPSKKTGKFPGYEIVGSLPGGGSGGKLYVAEPDETKAAALARAGLRDVRQVVIKSFSIHDGSSLPQIVRESRALDAAKKLGLVLDHELTNERFFYVMKYVPGQSLGLVSQQLHTSSPDAGLADMQLRAALGYSADLLRTLQAYHAGGLWHKDVKPDNIIVDGREAHLVDFGLVTPLRSAMTLTTHGTEYFRDPEMVRLALRGVKVHEVDGAKFDIYGVGAVVYSLIENSFPAHGVLSPINKRCPEALRWVIRRAMTDYDKRYTSAGQMLADLDVVRLSRDPFAVKPIDLPSMRSAGVANAAEEADAAVHAAARDAGHFAPASPVAAAAAAAAAAVAMGATPAQAAQAAQAATVGAAAAATTVGRKPKIRLLNWWTGGYTTDGVPAHQAAYTPVYAAEPDVAPVNFRGSPAPHANMPRRSAAEQLERARTRAAEIRRRAHERRTSRRSSHRRIAKSDFNNAPNAGVILASLFVIGLVIAGVGAFAFRASQRPRLSIPAVPYEISQDGPMTTIRLSRTALPSIDRGLPAAAPQAPEAPDAPGFRVEDHHTAAVAPVPAPVHTVALSPDQIRGTALFISDFRAPAPDSVRGLADRAREALADFGIETIGDLPAPGPGPAAESDPSEVDLIAGLRAELGLVPLDATEATTKLVSWLRTHHDKVQALIWFSSSTDGDEPVIRLIGPLRDGPFNDDEILDIRERLTESLATEE